MKTKTAKPSRHVTKDGYEYLTKRELVTKAQNAGKKAAKQAMDTMGYVVTVLDGWVVEKYSDGRIVRLKEV